mmetsp:Transcript_15791/g.20778  ORF Transcript_15791/g.20778 Transcript_15791/m.20778 type:complete len:141 (+) Transcript_15791:208-630(+)|eukprot:CAMPEP_0197296456 /NCGR_PEP_ID=MMETSP0890-20130614/38445_1 /TAXON_ID=44058 ORGANISM="Aureoumbra lagunensis, Strain CCMP1510" /NCGR_SAMPLE_ID=MMETSP0890 /ASSEMBLY_ACC=CAM_ASM_000533 /LENGTH=140 /DNA_ID=CAMNT_0042773015 /DNA_START=204 /DNA_END=626 /DNA_ORIENTATION=+
MEEQIKDLVAAVYADGKPKKSKFMVLDLTQEEEDDDDDVLDLTIQEKTTEISKKKVTVTNEEKETTTTISTTIRSVPVKSPCAQAEKNTLHNYFKSKPSISKKSKVAPGVATIPSTKLVCPQRSYYTWPKACLFSETRGT